MTELANANANANAIVGVRQSWRDLWGARYLTYQLVRRDVRVRYKQAIMGVAWAFLMPLIIVLSGLMVRTIISHLSEAPPDDTSGAAGLVVKALPWAFFTGSLGAATNSIAGSHSLVSKVYFPREILPLAAITATGFDTIIGSFAVMIALPFMGVTPSWALLWLPLLAMLLVLFTLACGLLFSCANVFFRDVKYLVQVILTFGIFFTPVFFEPEMLGELGHWLMLNPVAPILEGVRLCVVEGHDLSKPLIQDGLTVWNPLYLVYSAVWAVGGLILSDAIFRRAEQVMAEYV
jgi:lipopolysaccharide transport system permease protein